MSEVVTALQDIITRMEGSQGGAVWRDPHGRSNGFEGDVGGVLVHSTMIGR
jgi:hypothetical protein